jgi:hypothetical protein
MYDYVYQLAALTPGQAFVDGAAVLQLDAEAPFAMRGRAIYSEGGSAHQASTLNVLTRFQQAQSRFVSNKAWPASIDMMFAGYNGIFSPVHPQLIFPAGGIIQQSISNPSTNASLTNFMLIYRGVKIFPPGGALVRKLPNVRVKIETRSYSQTVVINAVQTISRIPFNVGTDSDFILRAIQVGTQSSPRYSSLLIQLRDSQQKPYSSLPIPIDYLCGNASAAVNNTANGQNVQIGNWIPGLIMPELYLLRGDQLFFDLIRNDGGGVSNTLTFNWIGAKVTAG